MTGQTIPQFTRQPSARRCPFCNRTYLRDPIARRSSRDHILPKSEGYIRDYLDCGATNIRIMCVECNSMRGTAAHCMAMVACARAVAQDRRMDPVTILGQWIRQAQ